MRLSREDLETLRLVKADTPLTGNANGGWMSHSGEVTIKTDRICHGFIKGISAAQASKVLISYPYEKGTYYTARFGDHIDVDKWFTWLLKESPWKHAYVYKSLSSVKKYGFLVDPSVPSNVALIAMYSTRAHTSRPNVVATMQRLIELGVNSRVAYVAANLHPLPYSAGRGRTPENTTLCSLYPSDDGPLFSSGYSKTSDTFLELSSFDLRGYLRFVQEEQGGARHNPPFNRNSWCSGPYYWASTTYISGKHEGAAPYHTPVPTSDFLPSEILNLNRELAVMEDPVVSVVRREGVEQHLVSNSKVTEYLQAYGGMMMGLLDEAANQVYGEDYDEL
jgi:hypothetical protein